MKMRFRGRRIYRFGKSNWEGGIDCMKASAAFEEQSGGALLSLGWRRKAPPPEKKDFFVHIFRNNEAELEIEKLTTHV